MAVRLPLACSLTNADKSAEIGAPPAGDIAMPAELNNAGPGDGHLSTGPCRRDPAINADAICPREYRR